LGVADIIRERIAKVGFGGDEAKRIVGSPWMQQQLRPIFDDQKSFDQFVNSVTKETTMFNTRRSLLGGSPTAERLEDQQGSEALIAGAKGVKNLAFGNILPAIENFYRAYRNAGIRPSPELNAQIARILFDPSASLDPIVHSTATRLIENMRPVKAMGAVAGAAEVGKSTTQKPDYVSNLARSVSP
jgi:hypothetical protein